MADSVKVGVRVRPTNKREMTKDFRYVVKMVGSQTILLNPTTKTEKTFNFDHSFWSTNKEDAHFATQDHVFDKLGNGVLDNAFGGYNACIFAYGQTGSGKTFTMMGNEELPGIIPRLCTSLFDKISENTNPDLTYHVEVSYMEIYNEKVQDLLTTERKKKGLRVREHKALGPYVEGLSKLAVTDYDTIAGLMVEGNQMRHTAATLMNDQSSRSHAVFTIVMTQRQKDVATKQTGEKVSRISLVDLAGSERSSKTGATGDRLKEGANINKSLTTLGLVISALADKAGAGKDAKNKFVPYRDSTLTWLLKDNLGGNSKTVMVATISPAADNYEETLSTLRYADRAKRIVNKAVVNEDPNAKVIRELREELERLRASVGPGGGGSGGGGGADEAELLATKQKLQETESLIAEMSQSWEEKLRQTESVLAEKQKLLEDHAASVQGQGDHALQVTSKLPHFVSLSDDPLASDITIYTFREGSTTIGREDAEEENDIKIWGLGTEGEHCEIQYSIEYDEEQACLMEVVILLPYAEHCYVNGELVSNATRLRQGNVVQLGHTNVFRFNHPTEAERMRKLGQSSSSSSVHLQTVFNPAKKLEDMHKQEAERIASEKAHVEAQRAQVEAEKARLLEESERHAARMAELQAQEQQAAADREARRERDAAEREAETARMKEQQERERSDRERQEQENEALKRQLAELENKMREEFRRAEEERVKREELEKVALEKAAAAAAEQEKLLQKMQEDKAGEAEAARQLRELKAQQEREAAEQEKQLTAMLAEQERSMLEREEQARKLIEERVRQAEAVLEREKALQEEANAKLVEAEAKLREQERLAEEERQRREELEKLATADAQKSIEAQQRALLEEKQRAEELAAKIQEAEQRIQAEAENRKSLESKLEAAERSAEQEKRRVEEEHLANERKLKQEAERRIREQEDTLAANKAKLEEERRKREEAEDRAKRETLSRELEQASFIKEQAEREQEEEKRRHKQEAAKRYWLEQIGKGYATLEDHLRDADQKGAHEEAKRRELETERKLKEERAREYQARVDAANKRRLEVAQQAAKLHQLKQMRTAKQAVPATDAPERRARNDELETEMRRQLLLLSIQPPEKETVAPVKEATKQPSLSNLRSAPASAPASTPTPTPASPSAAPPVSSSSAWAASPGASSNGSVTAKPATAPAPASASPQRKPESALPPTSPLSPASSTASDMSNNPFADGSNPFFTPDTSPTGSPDKATTASTSSAAAALGKGHPLAEFPVQPFASAKTSASTSSAASRQQKQKSTGTAADSGKAPHPFEDLDPFKSRPAAAAAAAAPNPEPPRRATAPSQQATLGRRASSDDAKRAPSAVPSMKRTVSSGSGTIASVGATKSRSSVHSAPASRNQTPEPKEAKAKMSEKELFRRNMEEGVKKVLAAQQEWDQTKRAAHKSRGKAKDVLGPESGDGKRHVLEASLPSIIKMTSRWGKGPKPSSDDQKPLS
eukprot:m.408038 g.408038  ORF g.408038 m.408038 type:complete len:1477 (+) comp20142_c1_seq2:683-5113(+)